MTDKEKLEKLNKLADAMYYAAQYLTTDASKLHIAMEEYHQFIIHEYFKEEPVSEDLEEAARNIRDRLYLEEGRRDEFGNPYFLQNTILKAVIIGAQWQKEQLVIWLKGEADYLIQEIKNGNKAYGLAEQYRSQLYKEIANKLKDD